MRLSRGLDREELNVLFGLDVRQNFLLVSLNFLRYHKCMDKVSVYNSDYTKLNHAYVLIFDFYKKMIECQDADEEVLAVLESILRVFNPALDRIKSEMTVKTRYKEDTSTQNNAPKQNGEENGSGGQGKNPYILTGNFTGE